ncbi:homeobox protein Hox-B6 isoform X3 [Grammomys surdaster]|uniref:homeobox protein Hox-B6 isoform X3 n=1 Tax=Grammomys surdaster TaxID=491861 RepID=UPI00109EE534|nr:homeobox protein Hox-B6 isoform X3 [Grammomys surdaster]
MSSYFVNSTFPVTLASGQESFLGQLPLYSSGYADPLRHYPAPYGPGPGQDKGFAASSYYPPAGGGYGRAAPCDYGPAPAFYREKDAACALSGADEPPPFHPEPRKSDCAQDKSVFGETEEQKCSTPVYPWMQRMNSCNRHESEELLTRTMNRSTSLWIKGQNLSSSMVGRAGWMERKGKKRYSS